MRERDGEQSLRAPNNSGEDWTLQAHCLWLPGKSAWLKTLGLGGHKVLVTLKENLIFFLMGVTWTMSGIHLMSRSGLLNLGVCDTWDGIVLLHGSYPVLCRTFSSNPGLHLRYEMLVARTPELSQPKRPQNPPGTKPLSSESQGLHGCQNLTGSFSKIGLPGSPVGERG